MESISQEERGREGGRERWVGGTQKTKLGVSVERFSNWFVSAARISS